MDEVAVCLCVIFTHKYETNVPRLREIYKDRFSKVVFLMPFYRGTEPDILPYYANSYYFQLSVTQNIKALKAINANHYIFIADDLILNPTIDERNAIRFLRGSIDAISIPTVANLIDQSSFSWLRRLDIARLRANAVGVEWDGLLPPYEAMVKKIANIGRTHRVDITHFCGELIRLGHNLSSERPLIIDPPYPCLAAYSDILVIPKAFLDDFAHYAGVTGAMKLFVEVAIPTVSLIVSDKLNFIPVLYFGSYPNEVDHSGKGLTFWAKGIDEFCAECKSKLSNAFAGPRSETLFIHPIKLSKWT